MGKVLTQEISESVYLTNKVNVQKEFEEASNTTMTMIIICSYNFQPREHIFCYMLQ